LGPGRLARRRLGPGPLSLAAIVLLRLARLAAVGLAQHPTAERAAFPAGPYLPFGRGLDLGPLGLDPALPGFADPAPREGHNERGDLLPLRGAGRGSARSAACLGRLATWLGRVPTCLGLALCLVHATCRILPLFLSQLAPGVVLPSRDLVLAGTWPDAPHCPVDDVLVGVGEAAQSSDLPS